MPRARTSCGPRTTIRRWLVRRRVWWPTTCRRPRRRCARIWRPIRPMSLRCGCSRRSPGGCVAMVMPSASSSAAWNWHPASMPPATTTPSCCCARPRPPRRCPKWSGCWDTSPPISPTGPSHAAVLASLGDYIRSIAVLEAVLRTNARQPRIWMTYGHALKTAGRSADCVAAYRRAIALEPTLGEAYWSLANLKTFRFTAEDIETMRTRLARLDLAPADRLHFEFALGKALEDEGQLRARLRPLQRRQCAAAAAASLSRRGNHRLRAPRQGAVHAGVLRAALEQRLQRHRPDLHPGHAARRLDPDRADPRQPLPGRGHHGAARHPGHRPRTVRPARTGPRRPVPGSAGEFAPATLRRLGERFLSSTRIQRRTSAPFFIDKMPNNWLHLGLIHLILPNARIIDARRHPMACCFSNFKQHFARGQSFSYSLDDLAAYYRDYVDLMAHFDRGAAGPHAPGDLRTAGG